MSEKHQRKHTSKRSPVWNHFMDTKIGSSRYACCLHCKNGRYLMNGSCPSGNMVYHLKVAHQAIYATLQITGRPTKANDDKRQRQRQQMALNHQTGELRIHSPAEVPITITNQMNSEGTIQPRTAVQLQTLWKNLTCRAKNKLNESRSDSLLGLSTAQSREDSGEIAPMDARVLSILDDLGASSSVGSGSMDRYGDEPSVSKTASDDSLDWMAGLSAMQTIKSEIIDEYDNDVRGASPADVSQSIETPLPVEKSVPESSCPPKDHDGQSSSDFMFNDPVSLSSKQSVADARNLYMELLNEKRAHLSLKRLKIEAKLKQVELKNRALETAIDANIAKRSKYEEEAKNLHLQNLQVMRTLKCNGFSNSSNVEQIFPPFV